MNRVVPKNNSFLGRCAAKEGARIHKPPVQSMKSFRTRRPAPDTTQPNASVTSPSPSGGRGGTLPSWAPRVTWAPAPPRRSPASAAAAAAAAPAQSPALCVRVRG